jgi:iron complex outermembrane recepter protein
MHKFIRLFSVSLFLLTLFSLTIFAQSNATISGTVTFADNSTPLHDATVKIVQLNRTANTDEVGKYQFTDVPPGRYTLLTHIEGFADASKIIVVVANAAATVDFQLQVTSLREQVTVTSSGTEQSVFDSFQTVDSIGSTRITQKGATSIGEVLENETGVAKRSFGPGTSRPVIRGFDGDRVLVLQNGLRSGSVGSQSGDHGEPLDPLSAERIEVVKGPATLLYGSNALGGVVNVIDNDQFDWHKDFRGYLTGLGSTADRQRAFSSGLDFGFLNNWMLRGNFSIQRSGDYSTPLGRVQNSSSRSTFGTFGGGYYGDKAYVTGYFNTDVRRYGVPYAPLFEEGEGNEFDLTRLPDPLDEEIDLRLRRYNFRITGGFRNLTNPFLSGMQYNLDYTDYRHKEIETVDGVDEVGTIFDNKTFSYRTLFEQSKYKALTGRFGFEGFNRNYEVNGAEQLIQGEVKHNMISAFTLQELGFERIRFQFGGRIENNRYRPENADLIDRSFTGFSGAFGVNVPLWQGGAFVTNFSLASRAPALEELYNNGPHIGTVTFEVGNQNLRMERSTGIDFSLRHLSDRFRFNFDVYYYRINNFVFLEPQDEDDDGEIDVEDGLPVGRYTQADARYLGAEANFDVTINRYFGVFAGADVTNAKLIATDTPLIRIPPARLRTGVNFFYKGLNVRPEAIFVAKRGVDDIFPLETPTAGYKLFNVAGSYTVGRAHYAHIFSFNAYNLTNELYRNHLSFIKNFAPEIGRGIRASYTIRFF